MELHLTVAHQAPSDPADAPATVLVDAVVDVVVEVRHTATARDLADALSTFLRVSRPVSVWTAGAAVPSGTPVGVPPLVDGAAVTLVHGERPTGKRPPPPPSSTPLELAVVHGPDAGRTYPLTTGTHVVGRGSDAPLALADHRLSRHHAEVRCSDVGVTVRDLGSTNGTALDGTPVGGTPVRWGPGQLLAVGASVLELRAAPMVPVACTSRPDGTRLVNRRPRLATGTPPVEVELPAPPSAPVPTRVPWPAVLLPLPVAAVMALLLGPAMLAFALMGPVVLLGTVVNDRWLARRRYAAQLAQHRALTDAAHERVAVACRAEVTQLRRSHPDPASLLRTAQTPGAQLWERRPGDGDALVVALGVGRRPAAVRVQQSGRSSAPVELPDAPLTVSLREDGPLGVAGPQDAVAAVARQVVGQLAVLHSPRDLRFTVLAADDCRVSEWQWMARLPHVRAPLGAIHPGTAAAGPEAVAQALNQLVQLVRARTSAQPAAARAADVVVVLDGAAELRAVPGLATVLEEGPAAGVHVVALDRDTGRLPVEAGAVLDLCGPVGVLTVGGSSREAAVDGVGAWWAERLSRSLAPLRDPAAQQGSGGLPRTVRWADLEPGPPSDPRAVATAWRSGRSCTAVPVGAGGNGTVRLDLLEHGPHFLVAGTTGAGKSELLRTLVLSLAAHNPPDLLSFLLVDYKGGAAFRECARLPHTSGLLTDLDERLAGRALVSLRAELRRRERLLAEAGVESFDSFHDASAPRALPRLVIVVDEFRALAEELPDFVSGMVRIAALGRSLGVHLVLATQRPSGVVTAEIKANVNGRIALRVRDRADSEDVVESPLAATIDGGTPGRGYLRTGAGPLQPFQAARVTAVGAHGSSALRVRELSWGHEPDVPVSHGHAGVDAMVRVIGEAARATGARAATPAWLPPLPTELHRGALLAQDGPAAVAIGLVDRPAEQAQTALRFDLDSPEHWAFVGSASSGRTTALLTACTAVAGRLPVTEAHLYAVSSGGLRQLEQLPHCGAHVDRADGSRLRRLVQRLGAEVAGRRERLAGSGLATFAQWRSALPAQQAPSYLVLAVDDWDLLGTGAGPTDDVAEELLRILREGSALGVRALLAGGRGLLHGSVSSLVGRRVVLRLTDSTDAALAGVPASWVRAEAPAGRGVLPDGLEVQLAVPAREDAPGQRSSTDRDGPTANGLPFRVAALPTHVRESQVPAVRGAVALGLGGDDGATVALRPDRHGRHWLVAGPAGSGVSTTLLVAARSMLDDGRHVVVVSARPGPVDVLRSDPRLTAWCGPDDAVRCLAELRRRHPGLDVVIEGAETLLDSPVEPVLRQHSAAAGPHGGLVVAGACTTDLASQFRGFAVELARHRTGVLLGPGGPGAGDVFGLRLPRDGATPPGRGLLVSRDGLVPFQVAQPEGVVDRTP